MTFHAGYGDSLFLVAFPDLFLLFQINPAVIPVITADAELFCLVGCQPSLLERIKIYISNPAGPIIRRVLVRDCLLYTSFKRVSNQSADRGDETDEQEGDLMRISVSTD